MYKWIIVLCSLLLFVGVSLSQQVRIERLGAEVESFRGEIYMLESRIPSLSDLEERVTGLESVGLDANEVWEGFNFPISLTGMRVFIGMFLDAIDEGSLRFNR